MRGEEEACRLVESALHLEVTCGFDRWDIDLIAAAMTYYEIVIKRRLGRVVNFDEVEKSLKEKVQTAGEKLVGGGVWTVEIVTLSEKAVRQIQDAGQHVGMNNCFFKTETTIEHDKLRFRSPAEVALYNELKKRQVLFFPNAAAVLGGTNEKREPDFLICHQGK